MEEEKPTTFNEKSVLWSFKVSTNLFHPAPGERGLRAYTLHAFTKYLLPAAIIEMNRILK